MASNLSFGALLSASNARLIPDSVTDILLVLKCNAVGTLFVAVYSIPQLAPIGEKRRNTILSQTYICSRQIDAV